MEFREIYKLLKEGMKFKRASWMDKFIEVKKGKLVLNSGDNYTFSGDDLVTTDWMLI